MQSMTGFGKGELESDKYRLSVEIKSVNHRFKDIRFKMGSVFNKKELPMRQKVEGLFSRGSFDIYISYKKAQTSQTNNELDFNKIKTFVEQMKSHVGSENLQISPTDFLRPDFFIEDTDKEEELHLMAEKAFSDALDDLTKSREVEGAKLIEKLMDHASEYKKHFSEVVKLKEDYQSDVKQRLHKRFKQDAGELNIDEPRFLQEVIYYLEKLDIEEEINRIHIHLEKLDNTLSGNLKEIGRQLDFLVQELNRETNTIGSKSGSNDISENVVQMKVQLEKIREQALNLQ